MSCFLDTNILLYSISTASSEHRKHERAAAILEREDLALSVQVLQEFYVQATRAGRRDRIEHRLAVALMETWRRYAVVETTVALFDAALEICHRRHLSYRDSAIVAAAGFAGCAELLSEDMQDGLHVAGVTIRNPFA